MNFSNMKDLPRHTPIFECVDCNEIYTKDVPMCDQCGSICINHLGELDDNFRFKNKDDTTL